MTASSGFLRRLRLRHVVFLGLLLAGIIPLAVSSGLLIWQNRDLLKSQEEEELLRAARSLSRELDDSLTSLRLRTSQLGGQLLDLAPAGSDVLDLLRSERLGGYLEQLVRDDPHLLSVRLMEPERAVGPTVGPPGLPRQAYEAMEEAFRQAREQGEPTYRFVALPAGGGPAAALAVPVSAREGALRLVAVALTRLGALEREFEREAQGEVEALLLDREGVVLWAEGVGEGVLEIPREQARLASYANSPVNMIFEYEDLRGTRMAARLSRVPETGWTILLRRPAALAFEAVDRMVFNALLSSVLLVLLALLLSFLAARQLSQPIQRLAKTSHEIADGNFGRRVDTAGLHLELADLADDFNRMSQYVERYVRQLKEAAQANRDLFIGSLRAFVAAIDAKDPYTRGHSERVAKVSRLLGRYLGMSEENQESIWIAALLHDVGKIGVEDRVLQKVGRLTDEEFDQMKLHPVIGAEIIAPIDQLKHALPVIRWHHENWNGKGYPDGLKGEEIPLAARIVAVADTFDAVTTNRPYQQAFTLEFAVETIRKLTGKRFDAKITTAFLRAYEEGEIRIAEEPDRRPRKAETEVVERSESEVEKRVLSMT